ncbi:Adhesion G-protein coupled receptor G6 [Labeo rohita]|uniref:Adhesion G-protein coupled receptor G6 n=5 Tax=Labeonini TaxID=2743697 RepID=A0ABQ8LTT9_LABRO|nr:Adhesion G-protein coupled receptor G6 [Labeo rohita]
MCSGIESRYILHLNGSAWRCVTCVDGRSYTTTDNPTTSFMSHKTTQEHTNPLMAAEALNKLESKMEEMEKSNKTNETIVIGDALGLLYVQAKNTETKDIYICYSSNQVTVVENQSDLKINCPWFTKISKEAFDKSRLQNNGSAFVGILRFNLKNKVREESCVSWDDKGELNWTTSGCETVRINNNTINCSCSHLTTFAVLMSVPEVTAPNKESPTFITSIGCGISIFFLTLGLSMHFLLRKAKSNQATKILMNMFVSLCLLNAAFLSNESVANTQDNTACVFIALVLHYSMLASFTWFFIQALHMYLWLIRQNVTITNYVWKITVLGWVCPAPIVVVIVSVGGYKAMNLNEISGRIAQMCWITNPYIYYTVNIGYYALVFILMGGTFINILTRIVQAKNIRVTGSKRKTFRKQLMMVLSLFLLCGLTWSVMFFSYLPMFIPPYYIFTVLNSLHGFFLFLYYYHIRKDVVGNFSDDPESTDSNTSIAQSSINAVLLSLGIMSQQKQNLLWLMIICCASCQISCLEIPPVDPGKKCRGTTSDDGICKESKGSSYVLRFIRNEWMCVTCPTSAVTVTLQPHEVTYNMSVQNDDGGGDVDPSEASDYLNKMESKMEEMEKYNINNINKAGIIMGDAIGLLHFQAKNTKTKDICYSSDEDIINDVDCQSDLNANFPWSVKISSKAFNKSRRKNNGTAFLGILQFYNMRNKDETKTVLNNAVYGITMKANISKLTDNIDMFFTKNDQEGKASCVSWDGKGELHWTTFGCETQTINDTIKCSCSHLTFFAVLMSLPDENETAPHLETLTLISSIGCGISIFFLSIALFMHFLLRKAISNQATKILMNMFVSLCLLNAAFLSNESVANTQDNTACVFIALVLHYSMLASFTWFFIQALHMYLWLIRQNVTITNYMRKITVLGWACPAPIVVLIISIGGYKAVTLNTTTGKITRMCWITNPYIHYIVNIGYYALVFIFTTGIFIIIVTKVVQARIIRATDGKRKTFRKQLMMVLSLFLLFGLTWSVMFFSYGAMIIPSYYIFTVLNSFQGFFLFLYYYHIHNDVAGHFSDDPESTDSTTTIAQSSINAVYDNAVVSGNYVSTKAEFAVADDHLLFYVPDKYIIKCKLFFLVSGKCKTYSFKLSVQRQHKDETKNQTILNNEVYGITMRANITNLTNSIDMFFTNNEMERKASCRSWDGKGELNWTTSGCETEINGNSIKCSCSHLTFFAVLMIPQSQSDANKTAPHLESLTLITSIGCGISMFFLSIALFMHFLLRKAKSNQATKILMNMFVSLCLLNAAFLSNESVANTQDNTACVFIALVLHYSMLASFTWFFIQALHMYLWLIRQNVTITNYVRKITVLGWVCPVPIVVVIASVREYKSVILNATSEKSQECKLCWITNACIHYIVNIGYYTLVFILTTGIFIMIVTKVIQARIIRATDGKRKTFRKQLMMVLSLFLLFGFFLFLYYYHIHSDVAGHFSDEPKSTDSNTTNAQSSINALFLGIMSCQKQNLLWLMIVSCALCQIRQCKTYSFKLTVQGQKKEIRMKEMVTDINRTFLLKTKKCEQLTRNSESKGNSYVLRFINSKWMCVTCHTNVTLKPHEVIYNMSVQDDGDVDLSEASEYMNKMESKMEEMTKYNISKAGIIMGDAIGVLHLQAKNTKTKDICYSSDEDIINDVDCQSDLNANFPWSNEFQSEKFTVLNNEVYGITMRANITNLTDNIEMIFTKNHQVGEPSCVSWDGKGELNWTTSGCETEIINNNTIKCSCSHLTCFSVIKRLPNVKITAPHQESPTSITSIGCSISMFFMAIALFMHFLLRCWITNPYIHYIVNIGYYTLVFIFTTGIFIIIVTKVVQARIIRATDGKRKMFRKQLMMVLSLFLLFGLTWSVMFFSYGAMIIPSYYIFTVLNSFQGFFLFLYYYHIRNDVAGHFSDDPDNNDSNTIISQSSINALEDF